MDVDNLATEARAKAGCHKRRGVMPASTPTLRDMIQEARRRGDLTYEQLAAKAIDPVTGETVSAATFNNIVLNKVNRMPRDYDLRAIAAGLGQPYEAVGRAAIAQWLPGVLEEADTESLVRKADRLAAEVARLTEEVRRERASSADVPDRPRETA